MYLAHESIIDQTLFLRINRNFCSWRWVFKLYIRKVNNQHSPSTSPFRVPMATHALSGGARRWGCAALARKFFVLKTVHTFFRCSFVFRSSVWKVMLKPKCFLRLEVETLPGFHLAS